jgi:hypothetical protein
LEIFQNIVRYDSLILNENLRGNLHLKLAGLLFSSQRYPEAIREYTYANTTFLSSDSILVADSFLFRSQDYENIGSLIFSMTEYQKARSIYSSIGNELYESYALSGIVILYSKFSLYDEAEKIHLKLKNYYSRNNQPTYVAIQYYNQAEDYVKLDLKSKIEEELLSIERQLPLDKPFPDLEILLKLKLSIHYAEEGNLVAQSSYFNQAETLMATYKSISDNNLIDLYARYWLKYTQSDDLGALRLAKQMLEKARQTDEMEHYFYAYKVLGKSYEEVGDFRNALLYQKRFKDFQDPIFVVNRATTFAYYQTLYETEKKELEIVNKSAEIKEINQLNKTRIQYFIAVVLLLMVTGVLIFFGKTFKSPEGEQNFNQNFLRSFLKTKRKSVPEFRRILKTGWDKAC